jgi:hypothetical protein
MMTFSINTGTNTETTSYQLTDFLGDQSGFNNLLNRLPDNKDGLINPVDLRDFFLSILSSSVFKITTSIDSNVPYIGIDTLNPDDNDIKDRKIFFGKRSYQSNDIMTEDLINSDYDILFYNTKNDNQQQFTTKISLLSGITNFQNSPFIQSQTIFGTTSVSFDFNSNGSINLSSSDILINDYKLPNSASASNGKIISWQDDSMIYNNLTTQLPSTIGTTSQPLNIFGNPTNINGYDFSFTDNRKSPVEIGDIKFGTTFSNFNISEVLQRIVYQYLPPISTIRLLPPHEKGYVEFGELPSVSLEFTIFKRTLNTNTTSLLNMTPGTFPAITTQQYSSITATASGLITSSLNTSGVTFSVFVNDGSQSNSSSTNIRGIYPYFYGFSSPSINNSNLLQLVKLVEDKSDKDIIIQPGSGTFYFIYDNLYGDLDEILNQNDQPLIINDDFDVFTQTLSSPNGLWVNKVFKIYRINNLQTSIPIVFKFKY